jgi:hypothetical protein
MLTLFDGTEIVLRLVAAIEPIRNTSAGKSYVVHFSGGYSLEILEDRQYVYPETGQLPLKQLPRDELIKAIAKC